MVDYRVVAANLACVNHSDVVALFECRECRLHLCADCVHHRWTPRGFVDDCPRCKIPAQEIAGAAAGQRGGKGIPRRGPRAFIERIPDFLVFPVTKSPMMICLGLAIITTPILWAIENNMSGILALIGTILIAALELATYFRFVTETAYGKLEVTALDLTDLWDDLIGPLFRYIIACLPMIAAIFWFGHKNGGIFIGLFAMAIDATVIFEDTGPAILYVCGLVLLPLLTVVAAISRSAVAVLNPVVWVQSLRVLGPTYLVAAAAFYLVLLFEVMFWRAMLLDLRMENPIPFLTPVLATALGYLAMALRARILGGLCEPYFHDMDD